MSLLKKSPRWVTSLITQMLWDSSVGCILWSSFDEWDDGRKLYYYRCSHASSVGTLKGNLACMQQQSEGSERQKRINGQRGYRCRRFASFNSWSGSNMSHSLLSSVFHVKWNTHLLHHKEAPDETLVHVLDGHGQQSAHTRNSTGNIYQQKSCCRANYIDKILCRKLCHLSPMPVGRL